MASLGEVGHSDDVPLVFEHGVEKNSSATERLRAIKSAITKKFNLDYLSPLTVTSSFLCW